MVDLGLDAVGMTAPAQIEVLCNELMRFRMFADEFSLPSEKIGYEAALKLRESICNARIHCAVGRGKVLPAINAVAPIIKPPSLVESVEIAPFSLHCFNKGRLHIWTSGVVGFGLVVDLVSDDRGMVSDMRNQGLDNSLGRSAIVGVGNVHVLTVAKLGLAIRTRHEDVRVFPR